VVGNSAKTPAVKDGLVERASLGEGHLVLQAGRGYHVRNVHQETTADFLFAVVQQDRTAGHDAVGMLGEVSQLERRGPGAAQKSHPCVGISLPTPDALHRMAQRS